VKKYVYTFGDGKADGGSEMKALLGGKGANLAEMNLIGLPVPPGFTISTEACLLYSKEGREACKKAIEKEVLEGIHHLEGIMGSKFGDPDHPLLLSVRSGARVSMPGMMDTVLNIGLNDKTAKAFGDRIGEHRFTFDAYRRLLQMYGDVVLGLKPEKGNEDLFDAEMERMKKQRGVSMDNELTTEDLEAIVVKFKEIIAEHHEEGFSDDPLEQLWNSIFAVFESWNNERARVYRKLNKIPHDWGTAVNVQAMVFGNLDNDSATGVAFTRNAATGENVFNGEFLVNAQGEDVVAGIRTPQEITIKGSREWADRNSVDEEERRAKFPSLEELMPVAYDELLSHARHLEQHYRDMQDMEFTVQQNKLWILQTRSGKRTGAAMVKIAMDMLEEGLIDEETALMRIETSKVDELLHPVFDKGAANFADLIANGLPASPGAASGQMVFFADDAEDWKKKGLKTILVRHETSPEDIQGMVAAEGILTTRGGMTSHAAIVARGMGKCCISGAGEISVNYKERSITVGERTFNEGDWISLNGTTGEIFSGKLPTIDAEISGEFEALLALSDNHARMEVRANADSRTDASVARDFGAKGIGLARTEHMFFEADQIIPMREMIMAETTKARRDALRKILPIQRKDMEDLFEVMNGYHVTIRLLDPPLHEFVPKEKESQQEIAKALGLPLNEIRSKVKQLQETNPMLGHRGCRLGISFPEVTEVQARAIIEAAISIKRKGLKVLPEIMVPLVGKIGEFVQQEKIVRQTAEQVFAEQGERVEYKVGTMIEVPRAAVTADEIASKAEFFSFGTNDLTQLTLGFSRDDVGSFLPLYLKEGIINYDPFERIDEEGVGQLVALAVKKAREQDPDFPLGVCGEHGGNPESIRFFNKIGLDYVSCSPFRVPVARIAAAQAAILQSVELTV
jgi:pyruvate,orthophosphate dikinase